ncbi:10551_t:CDS:1, partial [Ambispora leptoticha]
TVLFLGAAQYPDFPKITTLPTYLKTLNYAEVDVNQTTTNYEII